jgi:branched-subunit amino acid ABC-type transport system permease component
MALGLTLIFSILGVVSFSHGEFYMIGGMITYYVTVVWFPGYFPDRRDFDSMLSYLYSGGIVRAVVSNPHV